MSKRDNLIQIAKLHFYDTSIDDIAEKLSMSKETIKQYRATKEYKDIYSETTDRLHERSKKESSVRTRLLVERLLTELEQRIETSSDPLQYVDDVKQMYNITGISADTVAKMNVVKIADQLGVDEFNSRVVSEESDSIPEMEVREEGFKAIAESSDIEDTPKPPSEFSEKVSIETSALIERPISYKESSRETEDMLAAIDVKGDDIWD